MKFARRVLTSVLTLRHASSPDWDEETMTPVADGLAHFETGDDSRLADDNQFAAGVSASVEMTALRAPAWWYVTYMTTYSLRPFAAYAACYARERIENAGESAHSLVDSDEEDAERHSFAAGLLFAGIVSMETE